MSEPSIPESRPLRGMGLEPLQELRLVRSGRRPYRGQMWRKQDAQASVVDVYPGICLTVPLGTHFQFRSFGYEPLAAIGVTMPPWPGDGEAVEVTGDWTPTVT